MRFWRCVTITRMPGALFDLLYHQTHFSFCHWIYVADRIQIERDKHPEIIDTTQLLFSLYSNHLRHDWHNNVGDRPSKQLLLLSLSNATLSMAPRTRFWPWTFSPCRTHKVAIELQGFQQLVIKYILAEGHVGQDSICVHCSLLHLIIIHIPTYKKTLCDKKMPVARLSH